MNRYKRKSPLSVTVSYTKMSNTQVPRKSQFSRKESERASVVNQDRREKDQDRGSSSGTCLTAEEEVCSYVWEVWIRQDLEMTRISIKQG